MNIVLLEPEIPSNTGNIGRTCVASGTKLHLIKPLGFDVSDKAVKRAGLDYWSEIDVSYYEDFEDFLKRKSDGKIFMASTKAKKTYADVKYDDDCFIMFGKESRGIPEKILLKYKDDCIRIPMLEKYRSLNLSNSVAIILYEALRQNNFKNCLLEGELHRHSWDEVN